MDDKIKTILKANHLFDENNNRESFDIKFNKLDEFYDTYKQNHTNKQSIPEVKRDKNGRIILEEIPFVVSNLEDPHNNWLLLNNGTKLLVKKNRDRNENDFEVLISYFLKQLDIKHARYDIATFNGKEYLVTPSFLRNKEKVILPFDECPSIIEGYNKMKKYGGESFFLKTCFIDRIYGNIDRFPNNFGIIAGGMVNGRKAQARLCPLYDNATKNSILVREEKYGFFPFLSNQIISCKDMFSYLLDYEQIISFAKGPLKRANIYKAMEEVQKEKNIIMNNEYFSEIQHFFKDSEYLINGALKDKGTAFSIKLT